MYVTDIPVIDRMTDPAGREISVAMARFEDMTADLIGAADIVAFVAQEALKCADVECGHTHARDMGESLNYLSDCTELALDAQHAIRKALACLEIATL